MIEHFREQLEAGGWTIGSAHVEDGADADGSVVRTGQLAARRDDLAFSLVFEEIEGTVSAIVRVDA